MRLRADEIGVVLGLTSGAVRQIIRRENIAPTGRAGKANLYDIWPIVRAVGAHDRRNVRKRRVLMSQ